MREGDQLVIHYSLKVGDKFQDVADTFQIEGPLLRLTKSVYGEQEVTWQKNPWQKCA